MPKRLENARILIANTPMDTDKIKVFGSRVRVDSVAKVAELELAEKEKMKDKVEKILQHGCNVFINRSERNERNEEKRNDLFVFRQLIYDYPEQLFADRGVMAIEHADFEGVERLAQVLGGEIVSTFDTPDKVRLGKCDLIEEILIGEDKLIKFSGRFDANDVRKNVVLPLARFRCGARSGVYDRSAWCDATDFGRGRTFDSRRSVRSLPNGERAAHLLRWWGGRNAHGHGRVEIGRENARQRIRGDRIVRESSSSSRKTSFEPSLIEPWNFLLVTDDHR